MSLSAEGPATGRLALLGEASTGVTDHTIGATSTAIRPTLSRPGATLCHTRCSKNRTPANGTAVSTLAPNVSGTSQMLHCGYWVNTAICQNAVASRAMGNSQACQPPLR